MSSAAALSPDAVRQAAYVVGVADSFQISALVIAVWEVILLRHELWGDLVSALQGHWQNHKTVMLVAIASNVVHQLLSGLSTMAISPPQCGAVNLGADFSQALNVSAMLLTFDLRLNSCIGPRRWPISVFVFLLWLATATTWVAAAVATVNDPILPSVAQPMEGFWEICWKPLHKSYWKPIHGVLLAHTGALSIVAIALKVDATEEDARFMTTQAVLFFVPAFVSNLVSFILLITKAEIVWNSVAWWTTAFNTILAGRLVYQTNQTRILTTARPLEVRLSGIGDATAKDLPAPERNTARRLGVSSLLSSWRKSSQGSRNTAAMPLSTLSRATTTAETSSSSQSYFKGAGLSEPSLDPKRQTSQEWPKAPTVAAVFPRLHAQERRGVSNERMSAVRPRPSDQTGIEDVCDGFRDEDDVAL